MTILRRHTPSGTANAPCTREGPSVPDYVAGECGTLSVQGANAVLASSSFLLLQAVRQRMALAHVWSEVGALTATINQDRP